MLDGKKDFLGVQDFSASTLMGLIELAMKMKKDKKAYADSLKNKKLGMVFEKSSTRTRVSFEVGIYELGGMGLFLSSRDIQIGRGEPIKDTARVLSRYLDGMMIRTFGQNIVEELAEYSSIPVINALTDLLHPCQAVADFQTILEHKKSLDGLKVVFVGDGNNVAHSLGLLATKLGVDFAIAHPKGYEMDKTITEQMINNGKESGATVTITNDPVDAVDGADVIYTDVWISMGQEDEADERIKIFGDYQVNSELTKHAKDDYLFLHCLPAHRGEEVTDEIIEGKHSVVFDEAENRLHAQKAIMYNLMK